MHKTTGREHIKNPIDKRMYTYEANTSKKSTKGDMMLMFNKSST